MPRRFSLIACIALLAGGAAWASGLQVSPVSIDVPATQSAEGLWLSNTGDNVVNAQVRVYRWTQDEQGDQLTPTRDLLASPPMLELPVGERQLIRAVRLGPPPAGGVEQTYRMVIDELPLQTPTRKGLQYVLRYSVPVFVQPAGAPPSAPALQWALQRNGANVLLEVSNSGGTHAQLADLVYTDARGQRTEVAPGLLGYVLPGARMRWALKIPAAALTDGGQWQAMINGLTQPGIALAAPAR